MEILRRSVTTAELLRSSRLLRLPRLIPPRFARQPPPPLVTPLKARSSIRSRTNRRNILRNSSSRNIRPRTSNSMPNKTSSRSTNSRSTSRIRIRTTAVRTTRITTRWRIMLPSRPLLCRNTSSRHAPSRTIFGPPATGPTVRKATTGSLESGPPLPTPARYGLPDTGAMIRTAMVGTVDFGPATSATTAA